MKRFLLALTLWGAAFADYDFYLQDSSGAHTALGLETLQSLVFVQSYEEDASGEFGYVNRMTVNLSGSDSAASYDLAGYSALLFLDTDSATTALPRRVAAKFTESPFLFEAGRIVANSSGVLRVFHVNGKLVGQAYVRSGQVVDVSGFASGTYIVNLGGKAASFVVR